MSLATVSEKNIKLFSLLALIAAFVVGTGLFYTRYAYTEGGHGYVYAAYLLFCVLLMLCVNLRKGALAIVCVAILGGLLFYANKKFDWRQEYIQMAEAGRPFFLEEFIERYPTFEEHSFGFLNAPDWVRFNRECVQPALLNQQVQPRCTTIDLINRWYRIDIVNSVTNHFQKMRETARRINAGEMKKRTEYAECIARKECVTIPLLPRGVDAAMLAADSREYIGIRQAFWSLINDQKMSQEVCALTPVCKALVGMKAVQQDQLPF